MNTQRIQDSMCSYDHLMAERITLFKYCCKEPCHEDTETEDLCDFCGEPFEYIEGDSIYTESHTGCWSALKAGV